MFAFLVWACSLCIDTAQAGVGEGDLEYALSLLKLNSRFSRSKKAEEKKVKVRPTTLFRSKVHHPQSNAFPEEVRSKEGRGRCSVLTLRSFFRCLLTGHAWCVPGQWAREAGLCRHLQAARGRLQLERPAAAVDGRGRLRRHLLHLQGRAPSFGRRQARRRRC